LYASTAITGARGVALNMGFQNHLHAKPAEITLGQFAVHTTVPALAAGSNVRTSEKGNMVTTGIAAMWVYLVYKHVPLWP